MCRSAEAMMKGPAAGAGQGRTSAEAKAATPDQSATSADDRNLSPDPLTSEFHNA